MTNYSEVIRKMNTLRGKGQPLPAELQAELDRLAGKKQPSGEAGKGEEKPTPQGKA